MAERMARVEMDYEHRSRIQTTKLVERLQDHALGAIQMTNSQIRAAIALLKKTIPDLAAVEVTGDVSGSLLGVLAGLNDRSGEGAAAGVDSPVEAQGTGTVRH